NKAIAAWMKIVKQTVGKWRVRFIERCIAGLYDDVRSGKPRTIADERVAHLIKTTLNNQPARCALLPAVRATATFRSSTNCIDFAHVS
ncbi:hypothetical protein ABTK10_20175, partial [Acinetobacter baumannii]